MSVTDSGNNSSSGSESSPKQQHDDVPWARPEEFEAKKGIITHLYDLSGRNLTLKETMRIMEEKHGFYGTAKMYKSRISKWKLRKNLKPAEVIELVRQYKEREAAGKSTHVYFRGERMDQRRVREYLRLVHGMSAGPAASGSEKRIKIEGITCRTPSPPPSAAADVTTTMPMPMRTRDVPDDGAAREPERRSLAFQRMVTYGFESGFWRRTSDGYVEPCAAIKAWYRKTILVNRALQYGRMQLGFRLMQQCFDDFTALMRHPHPYLWIYTHRVAMELAEQSPEAAQSFARFACSLCHALNHPAYTSCNQVLHPDVESSETPRLSAMEIWEFYFHLLREQTGLDSSGRTSEPTYATARAAHYDLVDDTELGYHAMRKLAKTLSETACHPSPPPQVDDLRRKECQAWQSYYQGYYDDATHMMREINRPEWIQGIDQYPDALLTYYDTAALLARNRPKREQDEEDEVEQAAIGAYRVLIDFCTQEYGLGSLQTIDALAELETYLRGQQPQQPSWNPTAAASTTRADAVRQEIHAALDLLDCQTDTELGNPQASSSLSYIQQRDPSHDVEWTGMVPIDPTLQ